MALADIIHASFYTPSPEGAIGLPILIWGKPGIGKTAMIKQACGALHYERCSPGERGEGQFGVIPVPSADGCLDYPAPRFAGILKAKGGVFFIDEINTAAPALQSPLLGCVQLRMLGAEYLGYRCRVIAAANMTQDGAGTWPLGLAVRNRFGHYNYEGLPVQDWIGGTLAGWPQPESTMIDPLAEEKRVEIAWPAARAAAVGLVTGFIQRRPDMLRKAPPASSTILAYPSDRSVTYAIHALAGAQIHNLSEVDTDAFAAGFVGDAWMIEFSQFRRDADLPDVAALLDGQVKFVHDVRRLDRTLAVCNSAAAFVANPKTPNRADRAVRCWELLDSVFADAADAAVPAARTLVGAGLIAKASRPVRARFLPFLQAAGLAAGAE